MWSAIGASITAGKYGDSTPGPVTNCSQDTTTGKSADCRNFFQTYPDGSPPTFVYYHGYEPHLNDCLTQATGRATFLMNEGIGGYTSKKVLNNMSAYTQRIQTLGISHVLLLIGTNDANQGVTPSTWQSNVEGIINALKSAGVPAGNIWVGYVPYRLGSSTGAQDARQLIQQYNALLPTIKADTGVNLGPDFYTYFQNHQSLFADNLHPNQTGYNAMGDLWAKSIVPSETVCTAP
ncbi:MAG: SGNH/GDSL hydrolase family protein [Thermomicrobiaceae bacterium]|nr:SGNH/GDSL hydrolase family protein [Thermomicrobiaceae bacterium]